LSQPLTAPDLEDIEKRLELAHSRSSPALPFVMEVTLFRGETFVSDQDVDKQLAQFARMFPADHSFVLKLNGGLVEKSDIVKLNDKVCWRLFA
jgi:hypothetical protein